MSTAPTEGHPSTTGLSRRTGSGAPSRLEAQCCGKCIEQPFENLEAGFKDKIQHPAYPVEKLGGVLFAYMGPLEKRAQSAEVADPSCQDGVKKIDICEVLRCNWLRSDGEFRRPTHTDYLQSHS